jgi:hypothetical protein
MNCFDGAGEFEVMGITISSSFLLERYLQKLRRILPYVLGSSAELSLRFRKFRLEYERQRRQNFLGKPVKLMLNVQQQIDEKFGRAGQTL